MRFYHVSSIEFSAAVEHAATELRHGRPVGETLTRYARHEYADMECYLSPDRLTGFAVKLDGDLVSVFNVSPSSRGDAIVKAAIRHGARKLDAFDESGFLPALYGRHGFREVAREPWDAQYAPSPWSGATPDVVWMELQP